MENTVTRLPHQNRGEPPTAAGRSNSNITRDQNDPLYVRTYEELGQCSTLSKTSGRDTGFPNMPDRLRYEVTQLIHECAFYATTARRNANLTQGDVKELTGIAASTLSKIEGAALSVGPRLGTLAQIAKITATPLTFTLRLVNPDSGCKVPALLFALNGGDAAALSMQIFQQCRNAAGLSKEQLDVSLANIVTKDGKPAKSWNGYTAKVEAGNYPKGIRLGRIAEVAYQCGFVISLSYHDHRKE